MPIYKCELCDFTSKLKANYTRHLSCKKHKEKIQPELSKCYPNLSKTYPKTDSNVIQNYPKLSKKFICKNCEQSFSYCSGLSKHKKKCKHDKYSKLEESNKQKDEQIEELKEMINKLLMNISKPTTIEGSTTIEGNSTTIEGNNTNINQYIILNAFGQEKTEYITPAEVQKLINNEPMNAVPKILKEIHFNTQHKDNHNIYIPNKKQSYAKIYDGANWILTKKKQAIEEMASRAFSLIGDRKEINYSEQIAQIKSDYEEDKKNTVERIHGDAELMILNNQDNIKKE